MGILFGYFGGILVICMGLLLKCETSITIILSVLVSMLICMIISLIEYDNEKR